MERIVTLDRTDSNSEFRSVARFITAMEMWGVTHEHLQIPITNRGAQRNLAEFLKAGCPPFE